MAFDTKRASKKSRKHIGNEYFGKATEAEALGGELTAGTGVAITSDKVMLPREIILTVTDGNVAVTDANDYGSMKICDLPDTNIVIQGLEADLTLVKDGTGFIAATDVDVAIGTAAASNTTLSSTMVDVIAKKDLNDDSLTVEFEAHLNDESSAAAIHLDDSASLALYLNISAPTETSQDGAITVNGTVRLVLIDTGNDAS